MMMIMKLQIKLLRNLVGQPEYVLHQKWYGNPVLQVRLLDHNERMNYEEAMMSLDSEKWLEAMKSEMGSMNCLSEGIQISQENQTHQEMLQLHS